MQRGLAKIDRITIARQHPLVPCCYAEGKKERWSGRFQSCGAMIPYRPTMKCPECGHQQARANAPHPTERSRVLERDTAIIDEATGEVAVVYVVCAADIATDLAASLRNVVFGKDVYFNASTTNRLSGIAVTHRTFGYAPPSPMRRRWACSRSVFNSEHPLAMERLAEFCRVSEHVFRTYAEDVYNRTATAVRDTIAPAWLINGTPWSSGIINQTAALPYHRDRGNVRESWSAMLGARSGVDGGLLHLSDYDTYLPVAHGSITIFDGQSVVHGVTPMRMTKSNGWRYTCVTYAKQLMSHCCSDPAGEAKRAAIRATEMAEERRYRGAGTHEAERYRLAQIKALAEEADRE